MPRYSKEQGLCSHNFSPANVKAFVKLAFLFAGSEWEFVMHCSTGSRCTKLFPRFCVPIFPGRNSLHLGTFSRSGHWLQSSFCSKTRAMCTFWN